MPDNNLNGVGPTSWRHLISCLDCAAFRTPTTALQRGFLTCSIRLRNNTVIYIHRHTCTNHVVQSTISYTLNCNMLRRVIVKQCINRLYLTWEFDATAYQPMSAASALVTMVLLISCCNPRVNEKSNYIYCKSNTRCFHRVNNWISIQ